MNKLLRGDCLEQLKQLNDNTIDSIVTDPPYELGFMGKSWDSTGIAYNIELWKECLRVLKPGGHLLSFGGTRTYHRMACAIEDAGFEIRDQIQWIYGSGFPKSQNISKVIDKKLGAEREVIGTKNRNYHALYKTVNENDQNGWGDLKNQRYEEVTAPATEQSQYWDGWGTALKPANEPIVLARKPLSEKTIVDNLLKWGTGGINIDESRVPYEEGGTVATNPSLRTHINGGNGGHVISHETERRVVIPNSIGRFPANVILDEEAGKILDEQSGERPSGKSNGNAKVGENSNGSIQPLRRGNLIPRNDSGGASRFFYCPKASGKEKGDFNSHPTVKPIKLMEYLVNLVTPKGGIVLDPFAGSGSTLIASVNKGFNYIGIEKEQVYIEIIEKRIEGGN